MLIKVLPLAARRSLLVFFRHPCPQLSRKWSDDASQRLQNIPVDRIRNFCIIAHVDHGKSTLADRLLENTGAVTSVQRAQMLDNLKVEQERGITVKAQTASLFYTDSDKKQEYLLNLIDTPGHVDFCNEVYRSLSACDGAILLVDANHGIQAQTVSNFHLAKSKNLKIIPVLNKIDLKNANPEKVTDDLVKMFGFEYDDILRISAKMGIGVDQIIPEIIRRIPPPSIDENSNNFRGLIFDGWYDRYRGALSLIYVKGGELLAGQEVIVNSTNKSFEVKSISLLTPMEVPIKKLTPGQVGMIGCNIRNSKDSVVGDTIFLKGQKRGLPLTSFQKQKPMVFAGVYPLDQSKFTALRGAIEKLTLNDSAVTVQADSSAALGQGWRLGFLGLLHMEVFCQRLEQEHEAESIITNPSVTYRVHIKGAKLINHYGSDWIEITNPSLLPVDQNIEEVQEPTIAATIICPDKYLGSIMGLCLERRGQEAKVVNIDSDRLLMNYVFPLNEVIVDFYDKLKSLTSGYASFDYADNGYQTTNVVRMNILLNGVAIEELSTIVHVTKAKQSARELVDRLKNIIPRQMVEIAIQATVGGKVLARENIKAYRKDVTAKLYGGDVTRRMKLLRQQTEGKKKMRSVANINVPKDAFITLLRK